MTGRSAGDIWRSALRRWALPSEILDHAPADPFQIPAELFAPHHQRCSDAAQRAALDALGDGGTVLDVGCGCGAASLPLFPAATTLTGVDANPAMVECFDRHATAAGIDHAAVEGRWPYIADVVAPHRVVLAHHLANNITDIETFLTALTDHATATVVMEVTPVHPQFELNDLWWHFHHLTRPDGPTVDDLVAVLGELGIHPRVEHVIRPRAAEPLPRAQLVRFTRARLCLPPDADADIDRRLPKEFTVPPRDVTCLTWPAGATRSRQHQRPSGTPNGLSCECKEHSSSRSTGESPGLPTR